jgi:hypothetical protein
MSRRMKGFFSMFANEALSNEHSYIGWGVEKQIETDND